MVEFSLGTTRTPPKGLQSGLQTLRNLTEIFEVIDLYVRHKGASFPVQWWYPQFPLTIASLTGSVSFSKQHHVRLKSIFEFSVSRHSKGEKDHNRRCVLSEFEFEIPNPFIIGGEGRGSRDTAVSWTVGFLQSSWEVPERGLKRPFLTITPGIS